MKLSFRTWIEDAGHTDWNYSNADEPAYDSKIPSKYKARDFKPEGPDKERFDPDSTFGKKQRMKKRMKKKMKENSTYITGNGLAHKGENHG